MKSILFSLLSIIICIPALYAQCLYPQKVNDALSKAGKNKTSLENILKHYKKIQNAMLQHAFLLQTCLFINKQELLNGVTHK